jgi:hypothetical protein
MPDPSEDMPADSPAADGDGDGDGDGGGDGDGDGDGDDDGCADGWIECDGICVDPEDDPENCGGCGRTCVEKLDPILEGGCAGGQCRPMFSPCVSAEDGLFTCEEVCAAQGETCLDKTASPLCWYVGIGWQEDEVELCEGHFQEQGVSFGTFGCFDPIPFDESCGSQTCTHFVCCCSQTAQEP